MRNIFRLFLLANLSLVLLVGCGIKDGEKSGKSEDITFDEYYEKEYARLETDVEDGIELLEARTEGNIAFIGFSDVYDTIDEDTVYFSVFPSGEGVYTSEFNVESLELSFNYMRDGIFYIDVNNEVDESNERYASIIITRDGYYDFLEIEKKLESAKKSLVEGNINNIIGYKENYSFGEWNEEVTYDGSSENGEVELNETIKAIGNSKKETSLEDSVQFSELYSGTEENYPNFSYLKPENCDILDNIVNCRFSEKIEDEIESDFNLIEDFNYVLYFDEDKLQSVKYFGNRVYYYEDEIDYIDAKNYVEDGNDSWIVETLQDKKNYVSLESSMFEFYIDLDSEVEEYLFNANKMLLSDTEGVVSGKEFSAYFQPAYITFDGKVSKNRLNYTSEVTDPLYGETFTVNTSFNKNSIYKDSIPSPGVLFMVSKFTKDDCELVKNENKLKCSGEDFYTDNTGYSYINKVYYAYEYELYFDESKNLTKMDYFYDNFNLMFDGVIKETDDEIYKDFALSYFEIPLDSNLERDFDRSKSSEIEAGTFMFTFDGTVTYE